MIGHHADAVTCVSDLGDPCRESDVETLSERIHSSAVPTGRESVIVALPGSEEELGERAKSQGFGRLPVEQAHQGIDGCRGRRIRWTDESAEAVMQCDCVAHRRGEVLCSRLVRQESLDDLGSPLGRWIGLERAVDDTRPGDDVGDLGRQAGNPDLLEVGDHWRP